MPLLYIFKQATLKHAKIFNGLLRPALAGDDFNYSTYTIFKTSRLARIKQNYCSSLQIVLTKNCHCERKRSNPFIIAKPSVH